MYCQTWAMVAAIAALQAMVAANQFMLDELRSLRGQWAWGLIEARQRLFSPIRYLLGGGVAAEVSSAL
jgi:hypothetical protein